MAVKWLLVCCGFVVLAVFETRSLLANFATHFAAEGGDIFFGAYTLAWDAHALTGDPLRLFDANIAYPLERTLAFSDHLLGVMPLFAPVYLATGNTVLAYNAIPVELIRAGMLEVPLTRDTKANWKFSSAAAN